MNFCIVLRTVKTLASRFSLTVSTVAELTCNAVHILMHFRCNDIWQGLPTLVHVVICSICCLQYKIYTLVLQVINSAVACKQGYCPLQYSFLYYWASLVWSVLIKPNSGKVPIWLKFGSIHQVILDPRWAFAQRPFKPVFCAIQTHLLQLLVCDVQVPVGVIQ